MDEDEAALLAELRAISNRSAASRFQGDAENSQDQGEDRTALPEPESIASDARSGFSTDVSRASPLAPSAGGFRLSPSSSSQRDEHTLNEMPAHSSNRFDAALVGPEDDGTEAPANEPLPPWKRRGKKATAASFDVVVVASSPDVKVDINTTAQTISATEDTESSVQDLTSTVSGGRGGTAEDAELLAELRAISAKSSGAERFAGGDDTQGEDAPMPPNPPPKEERKPVANSLSEEDRPPWKQGKFSLKKTQGDGEAVRGVPSPPKQEAVSSELPPTAEKVDLPDSTASSDLPPASSVGFKSTFPTTFSGDRGGAAEDADLLAELRAISAKSSSANRFVNNPEESTSDAKPETIPVSQKKPEQQINVASRRPTKPSSSATPPWKRGEKKDAILRKEVEVDASRALSALQPAETTGGIKSDLPATFRGERGGPAEDSVLIAELRAISSKSTNQFADDVEQGKLLHGVAVDSETMHSQEHSEAPPQMIDPEVTIVPFRPMAPCSTPSIPPPPTQPTKPLITVHDLPYAVKDKNWKVRESAYELLQKMLNDEKSRTSNASNIKGEQVLAGLDGLIAPMVADSNVKALDGALRFAIDYADHCCDAGSAEHASAIATSLVKGNAFSSRPTTGKLAGALVLKLMEVGNEGTSSVHSLTDVLLSHGLSSRKPKVVIATVGLILESAYAFGAQSLPLASISQHAPKMLTHSTVTVRETGLKIVTEICRSLGSKAPLQNVIDALKSAQLSQLDALLERQPDPTPIRIGLRHQQEQSSGSLTDALASFETGKKGLEAKRYAEREAVNVLSAVAATEYSTRIKLPKWSEKVAALDILLERGGEKPYKLVQPPTANYQPLISEMKHLLSHSHFAVASKAMQVLSMLAEGVGEKLFPNLRPLFTTLLGLLKDKKLTRAVHSCLDSFFGNVLSIEHLTENEDSVPSAADEGNQKNALARASAIDFLGRCITRGSSAGKRGGVTSKSVLRVAEVCSSKLDDSDASVRKAAMEVFRILLSVEDACFADDIEPVLEDIKERNARAYKALKQIGAAGKKDVVRSAGVSGSSTKANLSRVSTTTGTIAQASEATRVTEAKNMRRDGGENPSTRTHSPTKSEGDGVQPSLSEGMAYVDSLNIPFWEADEDAGGVQAGLQSSKWQSRQQAIKALTSFASSPEFLGTFRPFHASALLVVVKERTKGFGETNFNLTKSIMELFVTLCRVHADSEEPIQDWVCWDGVKLSVDKIADKKLSTLSSELLSTLCIVKRSGSVMIRALEFLDNVKSPLSHEAFLNTFKQILIDFGATPFGNGFASIVPWLVEECGQANPKVRKAAMDVVSELHAQLGPTLKTLILSSCREPSTTSHVETALDRSPFDESQADLERNKKCLFLGMHGSVKAGASGDHGSLLEAPKFDLLGMLPKDCIQRMGSKEGKTAWKTRKGAMDEVDNALKKCKGLLSTNGSHLRDLVNLLRALRERLSDSQSNLKPVAARLIGSIVGSVDRLSQPRLGKITFMPLLGAAMNDNRRPMREACLESLRLGTAESAFEGTSLNPASLEVLMSSLASELGESEFKAIGIPDVLLFVSTTAEYLPNLDGVASSRGTSLGEKIGTALVGCLTSSKAEIRFAAEALLKTFIENDVISAVSSKKGMQTLLPAQQRTVGPVLSKLIDPPLLRHGKENHLPPDCGAARPTHRSRPVERRAGRGASVKGRNPRKTALNSGGSDRPDESHSDGNLQYRNLDPAAHPLLASVSSERRSRMPSRSINWPEYPEEPTGPVALISLKKYLSPCLTGAACQALFPEHGIRKQDDAVPGCALLSKTITYERKFGGDSVSGHLDGIVMWLSYSLCSRENTVGLQAILSLLRELISFLSDCECVFSDAQALFLVPHLFEKASVAKGRFREELSNIIVALKRDGVVSLKTLGQTVCVYLIERSQHAKTHGLAFVECNECVDEVGLSGIGKRGVLLAAKALSTESLPENKGAALELMLTVVAKMHGDIEKLARVCGPSYLSDKSKALLEERLTKHPSRKNEYTRRRSFRSTKDDPSSLPMDSETSAVAEKLPSLELRFESGSKSATDKTVASPIPTSGPFTFSFESHAANRSIGEKASRTVADDGSQSYAEAKAYAVPSQSSNDISSVGSTKASSVGAAASLRARLLKIRDKGTSENSPCATSTASPELLSPHARYSSRSGPDGLYLGSIQRMDELLHKSKPLTEMDDSLDSCISTLKTFHAAISNQPSSSVDESFETLSGLRQSIICRPVETIEHLTSVFVFAMDCEDPSRTAGMSIPLMSVGLATLMALFRDAEISQGASPDALTLLIRESGKALLDPRLSLSSQQAMSCQLDEATSSQMVRSINKLAVQAATGAPRSISLMALIALQVQLCLQPHDMPSHLAFNIRLSRIVTKLFAKVVKAEDALPTPFSAQSVDLEALLCAMDDALVSTSAAPRNHSMENAASVCFNMIKPLVESMLRSIAVGKEKMREYLLELGIDQSASKLSSLIEECDNNLHQELSKVPESMLPTDPMVSMSIADLVSAVGRAPEGPDRKAAVDALRRHNQTHGDAELNAHLKEVSSAFRDYVTQQLSAPSPPRLGDESQRKRSDLSERIRSLRSKLSATEAAVQSVVESDAPVVEYESVPKSVATPPSPRVAPLSSPRSRLSSPAGQARPTGSTASALRKRLAAAQESRQRTPSITEDDSSPNRGASASGHAAALRARLERVKLNARQGTSSSEH